MNTRLFENGRSGSVFIIVLWIAFGLVSLALYFADSMNAELRAADNRISAQAADQAVDGAARYVSYLLQTQILNGSNGCLPVLVDYQCKAVPVGDARFWLIGRDTNELASSGTVYFGLVDEASKLNLNYAPSNAVVWLPRMTLDLTQAILDWRSTNASGPTTLYYQMQQPPYQCKSDPFETVDELRLVYGASMDILLGEDANRNGVLDPNENDENQNRVVDPGILEYLTVYTREPNTNSSGAAKVLINPVNVNALTTMLRSSLGAGRSTQILTRLGLGGAAAPGGTGRGNNGGGNTGRGNNGGSGTTGGQGTTGGRNGPTTTATRSFASPLAFYQASGMTSTEFAQIATNLTTKSGAFIDGRVNVNTAPLAVLTCLLNGDASAAQQLLTYRQNNPSNLGSIAWVLDALGQNSATDMAVLQNSDCITTQTYQFTADIAAVGPHGRGFRRVKFVFDTSTGTPQIVYRQDLTHLGWALGKEVRDKWLLAKATP
jgi:type II secretory pathway component PulK